MLARASALLAGLWAGVLLCIGLLAAPAGFAVLASQDAGRLVGRLFAQEAYLSLALAVGFVLVERWRSRSAAAQEQQGPVLSANLLLLLGVLFCTVAGYFALQPLMAAARAGEGRWSFGQLHAASALLFGLKAVLVTALAWRLTRRPSS